MWELLDMKAKVGIEQIPPRGEQTVRYYGLYFSKSRGLEAKTGRLRSEMKDARRPEPEEKGPSGTLFILPPPELQSGRALRPLWRDLIMKVWGVDPLNPLRPRPEAPSGRKG